VAKKILKKGPEIASSPSFLVRLAVLELADVVDDSLAEAVDLHPRAVADTVPGRGHVDHVALAARCANTVVRLIIGDDDDGSLWIYLIIFQFELVSASGSGKVEVAVS